MEILDDLIISARLNLSFTPALSARSGCAPRGDHLTITRIDGQNDAESASDAQLAVSQYNQLRACVLFCPDARKFANERLLFFHVRSSSGETASVRQILRLRGMKVE